MTKQQIDKHMSTLVDVTVLINTAMIKAIDNNDHWSASHLGAL